MTTTALETILTELINHPNESAWFEFKTNVAAHHASITPEGIGEYISAISNGACISNKDFGYLALGVADGTHKVVGTNFLPRASKIGNQDFELWLRTMLLNPVQKKYR